MKKFVSVSLVAMMLFTCSISAFGATEVSTKEQLEKTIAAVKNVFLIPAEYTEFDYRISTDQKTSTNKQVWYLNWTDPDQELGYISASVDENGTILSFSKSVFKDDEKSGTTISKDQAQKSANDLLGKIKGESGANYRSEDISQNYPGSDSFDFGYREYRNDTPLRDSLVWIGVNKKTGEVRSYNTNIVSASSYPENIDTISYDQARESYIKNIGINLEYQYYYDSKKKESKIFPVYKRDTSYGRVIDGKTGEAIRLYDSQNDDQRYMSGEKNAMARDAGGSSMGGASLTKEELAAVEKSSTFLTKEKVEVLARSLVPGLSSDMALVEANIGKQYDQKNQYIWDLNFEKTGEPNDRVYVTIDATSGEVKTFYSDLKGMKKGTPVNEEAALTKARELAEKLSNGKLAQMKLFSNESYGVTPISKEITPTNYNFNFYREANGIKFQQNGISISYDNEIGMITSYRCTWNEEAIFPSIENVISKEAAFDQFASYEKYLMMYGQKSETEGILIYDFSQNGYLMIDPFTGKSVNYRGEEAKPSQVPSYSDISGHWSEAAINTLLENGIYMKSGVSEFRPDSMTTQVDFLRYLYGARGYQVETDDDIYDMLIRENIITKDEKNPSGMVSKQDATKYIVKYLGFQKIAKNSSIFNNPFSDQIKDEYKGYAAICYGLDIVKGDANGAFHGEKNITNAEAAVLIYNMIK